MAFQLGSNFELKQQVPLDTRVVVSNQTERNALVTNNQAYQGLIVYVTSENKYYFYNNSNQWIELNISGGGTANFNFSVISSPQTLVKNTRIGADTSSSGFTINLPTTNLVVGDTIEIIDYKKTFNINNLIIAGGSTVIENSSAGLTCNIQGAHFLLIWLGLPNGWRISIIDNNFSTSGVTASNNVVPLLYLRIQGTSELFDSPDSQNYKIPWNRVEWHDEKYVTVTNQNTIDNSKLITYNVTNKNIFIKESGIYNIDLRYSSFNLIDSSDFLRARLRSSSAPITGGLADLNQPLPRLPLGFVDPNSNVLAAFAQGPIGTSFNGEGMQAGFTTFLITGNTYMTTDFLHFGALNTSTSLTRGFPVFNNDFGNQPFAFITKIT
jgi:hypothetical protein